MTNEDINRCGICKIPCFERNNYYYGKLMTARDFFTEQNYFNEKRWLINRMIHGWGVVCGLDVQNVPGDEPKVLVTRGLAIDCCGREILVCHDKDVKLIPTEAECQHNTETEENELYIGIKFFTCEVEKVNIPPIECDKTESHRFNRVRDYFKICVLKPSEVDTDYPPGLCPLSDSATKIQDPRLYICEEMKKACPECPELPHNHAVILAKVTLNGGKVVDIECCPYRKQVYSNKILFDLINCYHGDLPHIIDINWAHNGEMDWADFTAKIQRQFEGGPDTDGEGLVVTFDKDIEGIDERTFLFIVKNVDTEGGYIHDWIIPGEVTYDGNTKTATFKVDQVWYQDMINYSFIHDGADFQVLIRGDHIVDKKTRRALDGNFIGGELPSGNGTQGDDFVSWFSVGSNPTPRERKKSRRDKSQTLQTNI